MNSQQIIKLVHYFTFKRVYLFKSTNGKLFANDGFTLYKA